MMSVSSKKGIRAILKKPNSEEQKQILDISDGGVRFGIEEVSNPKTPSRLSKERVRRQTITMRLIQEEDESNIYFWN